MRPALVAITRIVKARMATHTPAQKARASEGNLVTIPATGSLAHLVPSSVKYRWCWASYWIGKTLTPMVGRKADTKSTAAITKKVERGTVRPGFFASSDML